MTIPMVLVLAFVHGETVSGERFDGQLVGVDSSWQLTIDTGDGDRQIACTELIRWGQFHDSRQGTRILLADGGTLVADLLSVASDSITVGGSIWRDAVIPLEYVRGILLSPPADVGTRDRLVDRLRASSESRDSVTLENGDIISGQFVATATDANKDHSVLELISIKPQSGQPAIDIPIEKVVAVVLNSALIRAPTAERPTVSVGFSDSTHLSVTRIESQQDSLVVTLAGGIKLITWEKQNPWGHVSAIQPNPARVTYLSDIEPNSYRHTPWLTREWEWGADRGVGGGRLRGGDQVWLKGIAMHSRSRLAYDLDRSWRRFRADLALDDSVQVGGSVVFRVYLQSAEGEWRAAYESPTVRGGDRPVPLVVDLAGAVRLALIVDYADRGDELDHANWLGARFVAEDATVPAGE